MSKTQVFTCTLKQMSLIRRIQDLLQEPFASRDSITSLAIDEATEQIPDWEQRNRDLHRFQCYKDLNVPKQLILRFDDRNEEKFGALKKEMSKQLETRISVPYAVQLLWVNLIKTREQSEEITIEATANDLDYIRRLSSMITTLTSGREEEKNEIKRMVDAFYQERNGL